MKIQFILALMLIFSIFPAFQASASLMQMSEKQKIEYLIQSIEKLEGAKFYRNGEWHTPKEAADHLRLKLKNAGSRVKTARQFIDKLASESSMTGQVYKIKYKDGRVVESKVFFDEKLAKLK